MFSYCALHYLCVGQNIVIDFESNILIEGRDFEFNCTDTQNTGSPVLRVNGQLTGPIVDRIVASPDDVAARQFILPDVTRDDNGTIFRCSVGSSQQSVTLIVYCKYHDL